jgi:hypothetical protein
MNNNKPNPPSRITTLKYKGTDAAGKHTFISLGISINPDDVKPTEVIPEPIIPINNNNNNTVTLVEGIFPLNNYRNLYKHSKNVYTFKHN